MTQEIKYLSGTALAKELGMATRDFFSILVEMGYIEKDGDNWKLTDIGKDKGGLRHPAVREA